MPGGLLGGSRRCSDCGGTGECDRCFGTGRNTALNSDEDKCPDCNGTGQCPSCNDEDEIVTLGLSE
jgi:hypothetical protein